MWFPQKEFTQEYYDAKYFADPQGKSFDRGTGTIEHWGYRNPSGLWGGTKAIVDAWKTIFQSKNLLDVGCGRGSFIVPAREAGIEAEGFDFSNYAVNEGRVEGCKSEWLRVHDATKPWPYKNKEFDLTVALDFFEHIYTDDLPLVIQEMFRVSKKWVFLQIATVDGAKEKGYTLKKGEPIPWEDGRTWAGHCTVMSPDFWIEKFEHDEWIPRRDIVNWFCSLVDKNIIRNWLLNSIIVLSRI